MDITVIAFIAFCAVVAVCIIGIVIWRVMHLECFGIYAAWVLFILVTALVSFQPWRMFVG